MATHFLHSVSGADKQANPCFLELHFVVAKAIRKLTGKDMVFHDTITRGSVWGAVSGTTYNPVEVGKTLVLLYYYYIIITILLLYMYKSLKPQNSVQPPSRILRSPHTSL